MNLMPVFFCQHDFSYDAVIVPNCLSKKPVAMITRERKHITNDRHFV